VISASAVSVPTQLLGAFPFPVTGFLHEIVVFGRRSLLSSTQLTKLFHLFLKLLLFLI